MGETMPEYSFTVNGEPRVTTENKSLLRYLRDDLHLTSVKDGCSEGACGTCTIIVPVTAGTSTGTARRAAGASGRSPKREANESFVMSATMPSTARKGKAESRRRADHSSSSAIRPVRRMPSIHVAPSFRITRSGRRPHRWRTASA